MTNNYSLDFLAGGGETGALIRSFDWSGTCLGNPANWPKSLKTCVRIILTSRQPMFIWWGENLINIYNDPYQAIVGGKHPWALGRPASEVWKEIWDEVGPRAETALRTNEGTYDESLLLIMERYGYPEETYYTFSYSPVPGDSGRPEGIICANTDDTERIITERQLRTLKDLGKAFINSKTDDDIYLATTQVLQANAHDFPFAAIYQISGKEILLSHETANIDRDILPEKLDVSGSDHWGFSKVADSRAPILIEAEINRLPSGVWPVPPHHLYLLPIFKNTKELYGIMVIGLNPYRLPDNTYLEFFGLIADQIVTGINSVRAYEEERKRVKALEEIDKAKTVFFNNVSHEFRTPLTLMLGPIEELAKYDRPVTDPLHHSNVEAINRNSRRLLKLVNNLLEFSRIEAGRVQATFQALDICAVTRELASSFQSIIEKAGLTYVVDCAHITSTVYIDVEMWEKIVLNLLSNAFKYTLKGSITVRLVEVPGYLELRIMDSGVGIPKTELPRMFERFHRVPNSAGRTHEGTGIGLSLINELVKMHGGEITVDSIEGKGSSFSVKIPLGKAHLPASQVKEDGQIKLRNSLSSELAYEAAVLLQDEEHTAQDDMTTVFEETLVDRNTHVLVVDDNADMRAYLKRLISPYWEFNEARNGKEALGMIRNSTPDLIVADIMMPVMNGKDMVTAIRSEINYQHIPVIFLSAKAGEEARIEGLDAGANEYLVKPFSAKELNSKIRSLIELSRARNQAEKLLKQLFTNAPIAISILRGTSFIIDLANDLILEMWARERKNVIGKPLLDIFPELMEQGYMSLLKQVYDTGERLVANEAKVSLMRHGGSEELYVKFIYEPLFETDGRIGGVIVLAHEITDLVVARTNAQQSADELRKLVKQKDEFLSIASHELKTPITSMKAMMQFLDRMQHDDQRVNEFIKKVTRQINRLSLLVADLLDVSSLEAGKMRFYHERFDFSQLLSDIVEQQQSAASKHHLTIEKCDVIELVGDRNRLEQVVNNLISNAIKYSPNDPRVVLKAEERDKQLIFSVTDFGIGIPADKREYVFERFYRVEESVAHFSGMGLGLHISAEIVKRHDGKIFVDENPNGGSVFQVILPLDKI